MRRRNSLGMGADLFRHYWPVHDFSDFSMHASKLPISKSSSANLVVGGITTRTARSPATTGRTRCATAFAAAHRQRRRRHRVRRSSSARVERLDQRGSFSAGRHEQTTDAPGEGGVEGYARGLSIPPQPAKPRHIRRNIERRAFSLAVAEIIPDEKGVRALVGQGIAAGVAQHMGVDRHRQPGQLAIALDRMPGAAPIESAAALAQEKRQCLCLNFG